MEITQASTDERMVKNPHLTRQLSIIDTERLEKQKIYIVGCGAIGSFVALELAKMGITQIEVWDNDTVSIENMSNQFFRFSDIDKNKAKALHDLVFDFTGVKIKYHETKFEQGTACHVVFNNEDAIMISAVDSMAIRALIYNDIKSNELEQHVKYIIDPRMSAEAYLQFVADMTVAKSMDNYAKTLYSDENAVAERCTAKSTIYTATLAAGMVVKTVKNLVMREAFAKTIQWDIKASRQDTMQMFTHA